MPSTQELLQAVTTMQANAQANLPVMPNNGNPRGAYNMPNGIAPIDPGQNQDQQYFHSWMRPSKSMDMIQQMLSQPLQHSLNPDGTPMNQGNFPAYGGPPIGSPEWIAAKQAGQHPVRDWYKDHPRLPVTGGGMPASTVMPQTGGNQPANMVMPQTGGNQPATIPASQPIMPVYNGPVG